MMFCPKCGAQVPDGTKFCIKCGNALGGAPAQPTAPSAAPAPSAAGAGAGGGVAAAAGKINKKLIAIIVGAVVVVAAIALILSLTLFSAKPFTGTITFTPNGSSANVTVQVTDRQVIASADGYQIPVATIASTKHVNGGTVYELTDYAQEILDTLAQMDRNINRSYSRGYSNQPAMVASSIQSAALLLPDGLSSGKADGIWGLSVCYTATMDSTTSPAVLTIWLDASDGTVKYAGSATLNQAVDTVDVVAELSNSFNAASSQYDLAYSEMGNGTYALTMPDVSGSVSMTVTPL